jgi:hypothetical protein
MGALTHFFFGRGHIDWPTIKKYGTLGTPQLKHLFGPQPQNRNKCVRDKIEVVFGTS